MPHDYTIAVQVLTEVEKNRFLACYLNSTDTNAVDWQKAADDFGSASVGSFKKMIQSAFKKMKEARDKAANGEEIGAVAAATPASAKGKGGRKRKAVDEGGDDAEETPKPKAKRGRKAKKATPEVDVGDAADEERVVKTEGGDEE